MGFFVLFIQMLIQALTIAIFIRVLLSWVDPQKNMSVTRILDEITEPILGPIRSVLPSVGMFDFSPIVAFLLLQVVGGALVAALGG